MRQAPSVRTALRSQAVMLLAALVLAAAPAAAQQAPSSGGDIRIPFERITLKNGLEVLLSPDHSTPQVAVDIWYHVGSKNEQPGRTGFAHMFEHTMFTGSAHVPYGLQDRLTEGVGGGNNASTSNDRTNYYDIVPSNYLESALWIEADRMGFLLDKLDSTKFVAQRSIVQNERRQSTDNQPYGRAFEIMSAAVYPPSNPYSWPVVGYMTDLQHATVDDVKRFFRLYYAPSNATMSIVGDFDPAQVKQWITKYFSGLPRGEPIHRPDVKPVTLTAPKRLVYEDQVQVPRLYIDYPAVGEKDSDSEALSYLSDVLTGSRTARLTKALVYDLQSAAQVNAFPNQDENVGDFVVIVVPRPGHSLTEIEGTIDSVVAQLQAEGPTSEEMARAAAGLQFSFVSALESNLGKADLLDQGLVFHDDPSYFHEEYNRLRAVKAADVQRVAKKYLTANHVVLSIVPAGKTELAAKSDASVKVTVSADGGHYIMGDN
ncbi:MAG TPA: pitrilysin family protein [Gemmatimonadaceae bacterium]|nr:pitrilysin family protein [Gemmatimonadaceae bacterium]